MAASVDAGEARTRSGGHASTLMPARRAASMFPPTAVDVTAEAGSRRRTVVHDDHEAPRRCRDRERQATVRARTRQLRRPGRRRHHDDAERQAPQGGFRREIGSGAPPAARSGPDPATTGHHGPRPGSRVAERRRRCSATSRIPWSVMLMLCPSRPSTSSRAPCQARRPARVTTNAGTRKRVTQKPWMVPTGAPTTRPPMMASAALHPWRGVEHHHARRGQNPLTTPTDRSISPSSSTSTTPIEIVPDGGDLQHEVGEVHPPTGKLVVAQLEVKKDPPRDEAEDHRQVAELALRRELGAEVPQPDPDRRADLDRAVVDRADVHCSSSGAERGGRSVCARSASSDGITAGRRSEPSR